MSLKVFVLFAAVAAANAGHLLPTVRYAAPAISYAAPVVTKPEYIPESISTSYRHDIVAPSVKYADVSIPIGASVARVEHVGPSYASTYRSDVVSSPAVKYAVHSVPVARAELVVHDFGLGAVRSTVGVAAHGAVAAPLPIVRGIALGHTRYY